MNDMGLNEAETRAELIDPAIALAGWGKDDASKVMREVIAPGRLIGAGKRNKAINTRFNFNWSCISNCELWRWRRR